MRSRRPSRHGAQTVSYFLLLDCKSITYYKRTRGVKGGREGRTRVRERHRRNTYGGNYLSWALLKTKKKKRTDVRKKMTGVITSPEATDKKSSCLKT
jgi:hypothetical protein